MTSLRASMTINSRLHAGALAVLATLALAAFAAAPASAKAPAPSPVAFALSSVGRSGPMLLHAASGRVLHDAVSVRNVSGRPITVRLQAADIRNASNGNADYVTTRLSGAGRWLQLSATTVHLRAHATRRVAVTVTVPPRAAGASHYAGIVAINAADLSTAAAHRKVKGREFNFYRINRQALPITIRVPGQLSRGLALRSVKITVQPSGAGLTLGLLSGGSELIQQTQVKLHVQRGGRTVLTYNSTLGQLFPGNVLNFRIPWRGRPTTGDYQVSGTIRPQGARTITIDRALTFTAAKAKRLSNQTPPVAHPATSGTPGWVWFALAAAAALLLGLTFAVYKLARRPTIPAR